MKINELNQHITSARLFESLERGADQKTQRNLRVMYENFVVPTQRYLAELDMSQSQIQQAFTSAEQGAGALPGGNRTMLGKLKDAPGKAFDAIKAKFEKNLPAPDAGPVQGFEQKAEQVVQQIQDPAAKKQAEGLVQQGIKNPVVQQLIMAGISGAAGAAAGQLGSKIGGALGGAVTGGIVGGLLGVVATKLQGGTWAQAGKAGLRGAAVGAAGGAIGNLAAQGIGAGIDSFNHRNDPKINPMDPNGWNDGTAADGSDLNKEVVMPGQSLSDVARANGISVADLMGANPNITNPDSVQAGQELIIPPTNGSDVYAGGTGTYADTADNIARGNYTNSPISHRNDMTQAQADAISGRQDNLNNMQQQAGGGTTPIKTQADLDNYVQQSIDAGKTPTGNGGVGPNTPSDGSYQQAAPIGRDGQPMPRSTASTGVPYIDNLNRAAANGYRLREAAAATVIEYVDRRLTARMWLLHESVGKPRGGVHLTTEGIGDMFSKAGNWLKTKGANLTNKITADKLQQAWVKAKYPTESSQVAKVMMDAGIPEATVEQIFSSIGLPPGSTKALAAQDARDGRVEPTMDPKAQAKGDTANPEEPNAQAAGAGAGAGTTTKLNPGKPAFGQTSKDVANAFGLSNTAKSMDLYNKAKAKQNVQQQVDPASATAQAQATTTAAEPTAATSPTAATAPAADATSNDAEVDNKPANAPNPFGQMTGQLKSYAPPEKTSTGGTLTQTPTGQVHRANPNNPNAQANRAAAANQQQQQATQNAQPKRSVTGDVPVPANFGQAPQATTSQAATPQPRQSLSQKMATRGQAVKAPNAAGNQWAGRPKVKATANESFTRDFGAMLWNKMREGK